MIVRLVDNLVGTTGASNIINIPGCPHVESAIFQFEDGDAVTFTVDVQGRLSSNMPWETETTYTVGGQEKVVRLWPQMRVNITANDSSGNGCSVEACVPFGTDVPAAI